jgi:NAD(P)-dependent dehydrogenase (short-subunit alcohol dehydrogenase family)
VLSDKTMIISGAGPGLGREIALAARREGANLVLVARTQARLKQIANAVDSTGEHVTWCVADVTDASTAKRAIATALDKFACLDCVVHCAALAPMAGILEPDWDLMREAFDVNVWGPLRLTAAAVKPLSSRGGSIIFIGSHSSMWPRRGLVQLAYGSSKGALTSAMVQLARELGPLRIRVNTVVPTFMIGPAVLAGFERTAALEGISPAAVQQRVASEMMLGEVPHDEDVAEAIVFLASDRARMITGQSLLVNAGYYVR